MLKEKEMVLRRVQIMLDGAAICTAYIMAYLFRDKFRNIYKLDIFPFSQVVQEFSASLNDYLVILAAVVPIWLAALYWNGMYRSQRTTSLVEVIWTLIKAAAITTFLFGACVFIFKVEYISRLFFALFMTAALSALIIEKVAIFYIMRYIRKQGYNFRRLLVVGTGSRAVRFIRTVTGHPEWGIRIEGILDYEHSRKGNIIEGYEVIGSLPDLEGILRGIPIDEVIFIIPRSELNRIEKPLYACELIGVKASVAVDLFELKIAKSRQTEIEGMPLLVFDTVSGNEWQFFIKRAADILISAVSLVLLSPVFLIAAILIKATSSGPVFFLQKRVGLNGRDFVMLKFRTMYKGAHQRVAEFKDLNIMSGPVFKIKNDPRVTPVGRILRKFSIDEFPQLINVLIGHMSLVGPRPPLYKEVVKYEPWQRRRLSMRPGLTCYWQISGRNDIDFENWMKLDLKYIDTWSLWLDFSIILRTIPVVLFGKGGM